MTYTTKFYVWRRGDGYVSSTTYAPRFGDFEILLVTEDWAEARNCIRDNRDDRHNALVESWPEGV